MKTTSMILFTSLFAIVCYAQYNDTPQATSNKVVHFKKLQELLPTYTPDGFTRGKPTGSTSSAFGIAASEAYVHYSKSSEKENEIGVDITLKIMDNSMMGLTLLGMEMASGYESETEEGYEKSISFKGYRALEIVEYGVNGGTPSCNFKVLIGNRFLVEIDASNTKDIAMLKKLADNIDLAKVENITEE